MPALTGAIPRGIRAIETKRPPAGLLASLLLTLAVGFYAAGHLLLLLTPVAARPVSFHVWPQVLQSLSLLVYVTVGALIAARRPSNPIGWLLCLIGLTWEVLIFSDGYVSYGSAGPSARLPAVAWVALLHNFWIVSYGLVALVALLFPDGRLLSRRWRPVVWLIGAYIAAQLLGRAATPGPMSASLPGIRSPLGIVSLAGVVEWIPHAVGLALLGSYVLAALSLVLRFRRAGGLERLQLKWFAFACLLLVLVFVATAVVFFTPSLRALDPEAPNPAGLFLGIPTALALAGVPVATGVAILRYRLYDIDLLINRTLVYGGLTALVIGLYVLIVVGIGALLDTADNLLISLLATGLVAVLFQPLHIRLQRAVNRLLYGERDDPYAVLSRLGRRLEETLAPDTVLSTIVQTITEALKLPYAAIAVTHDGRCTVAAASGQPVETELRLPLVYQHETVGELVIAPRAPGEPFSPADRRLLDDLARQAGVAVHAMRLTADLQHARERLVTAREEERRRLRRDLHDGLGPQLASQTLTLAAARKLLAQDPAAADMLLAGLLEQTQDAVTGIRRLVYELRPPALDDLGLVGALREQAARYEQAGLRIAIEVPEPLLPLPAAIEVAAYRILQEALTNVVRHAEAEHCIVQLTLDGSVHGLCLEVRDDGRGLPPAARAGVGLTAMRERAEELGGYCTVEPCPGGGTRVRAYLPLPGEG